MNLVAEHQIHRIDLFFGWLFSFFFSFQVNVNALSLDKKNALIYHKISYKYQKSYHSFGLTLYSFSFESTFKNKIGNMMID